MRRRAGLVVVGGLVVPLVLAASAFGQGGTLVVTPSTATPGTVITVTGTGFNPSNANIASGVSFRLDTRDAEPLKTTSPTPQGTVSDTFVLPPGTAVGEHLVIGTQTSVRGRHTFGGPGRAKLRVVAGKAGAATAGGWSPADLPPAGIAGAILALIALAGGSALAVRRLRTPARSTRPDFSR